jgi:cytochrome c
MTKLAFSLTALVAGGLTVGIARASLGAAAAQDVEKGQALYEQCAACHSLDGTESDGPTLLGVYGRRAGSLDTFRYSAAMSRSTIVWSAETLDAFIADPQVSVPGNRMSFTGMTEKSERDDLLAYLESVAKPKE